MLPGTSGAKVGVGERVLARLFEQHAPVRNVVRKLARLDVGVGLGNPVRAS